MPETWARSRQWDNLGVFVESGFPLSLLNQLWSPRWRLVESLAAEGGLSSLSHYHWFLPMEGFEYSWELEVMILFVGVSVCAPHI